MLQWTKCPHGFDSRPYYFLNFCSRILKGAPTQGNRLKAKSPLRSLFLCLLLSNAFIQFCLLCQNDVLHRLIRNCLIEKGGGGHFQGK